MKKSFFLSKGLEKFSEQQINDLSLVKGGALPPEIYYPTGGGGRRCPEGLVWSESLQKCVGRYLPIEVAHFKI
ncbi:carbohydrate-binding module family 14 protein [Tenacibaculum ovolyticum]|uniref:carbohydrate-binding module family 14 protein n=1 Tax=Tenacibaculum ovolyticum TaxID=104270 RepID=UPI001F172992|nr:carbohydrate-binding module family 14 protein [Tenacibaculum ovolyticum]